MRIEERGFEEEGLLPRVQPASETWNQWFRSFVPVAANYIIFGLFYGPLYFFTSFAGLMKLVADKRASIPLGLITASADALTNAFLVPPETEVLFNFRPGTWILAFLVYSTLGELAALPLAVGVLQASEEISAKTGIEVERINPVLGNIALITPGVVFSIGFVNLIGSIWAHFRLKVLGHESQKYFLQYRYLEGSRSKEEYDRYRANPDKFLEDKFSKLNLTLLMLSAIPAIGMMVAIAGEILKALDRKEAMWMMHVLNFFGLIDIEAFARTDDGSKVVNCVTGVPLAMIFISTTLRTMPRDFGFLFKLLKHHEFKKSALMLFYPMFIATTCLTVMFETIRGGGNLFFILAAIFGAFLGNYSGPRDLYFNSLLPKLIQLCCCLKEIDINAFPAVAEREARKAAIEKFGEQEADFKAREAALPTSSFWVRVKDCGTRFTSRCSSFWNNNRPAQADSAEGTYVSVPSSSPVVTANVV